MKSSENALWKKDKSCDISITVYYKCYCITHNNKWTTLSRLLLSPHGAIVSCKKCNTHNNCKNILKMNWFQFWFFNSMTSTVIEFPIYVLWMRCNEMRYSIFMESINSIYTFLLTCQFGANSFISFWLCHNCKNIISNITRTVIEMLAWQLKYFVEFFWHLNIVLYI